MIKLELEGEQNWYAEAYILNYSNHQINLLLGLVYYPYAYAQADTPARPRSQDKKYCAFFIRLILNPLTINDINIANNYFYWNHGKIYSNFEACNCYMSEFTFTFIREKNGRLIEIYRKY